jgi:hypothetical protein
MAHNYLDWEEYCKGIDALEVFHFQQAARKTVRDRQKGRKTPLISDDGSLKITQKGSENDDSS